MRSNITAYIKPRQGGAWCKENRLLFTYGIFVEGEVDYSSSLGLLFLWISLTLQLTLASSPEFLGLVIKVKFNQICVHLKLIVLVRNMGGILSSASMGQQINSAAWRAHSISLIRIYTMNN